jgi:hypothetical protein
MGRKPLRLMASVTCRWASPLNEGLGITSCRTSGAERSPRDMGATKKEARHLFFAFLGSQPDSRSCGSGGFGFLPASSTAPLSSGLEPEVLQFALVLPLESMLAWRIQGVRSAELRRCVRARYYVRPNV